MMSNTLSTDLAMLQGDVCEVTRKLKALKGGVHADWARHAAIAITDLEAVEDRLGRAILEWHRESDSGAGG
jgi:hypothetical protein